MLAAVILGGVMCPGVIFPGVMLPGVILPWAMLAGVILGGVMLPCAMLAGVMGIGDDCSSAGVAAGGAGPGFILYALFSVECIPGMLTPGVDAIEWGGVPG